MTRTPVSSPASPSVARRMATVMVARTTAAGACTEDDLRRAGFSRADLARHADAARALASRDLVPDLDLVA
jgi:hypothetical protein